MSFVCGSYVMRGSLVSLREPNMAVFMGQGDNPTAVLEKRVSPLLVKKIPAKPHKSGPSKKEEMTAKIPKGNKMARKTSGRRP